MNNFPYTMPDKPTNGWQLLRWAIFEPLLLDQFSATLSRWQVVRHYLKAVLPICALALALYLSALAFIAFFDLPTVFPYFFRSSLVLEWTMSQFANLILLVKFSWGEFARGLAGGLAYLFAYFRLFSYPIRLVGGGCGTTHTCVTPLFGCQSRGWAEDWRKRRARTRNWGTILQRSFLSGGLCNAIWPC